jgi:excisionase family DNA binding protein
MEEILTAAQVADWLALSKARVYELAREGDIPHLPIGRAVRFRRSSVLEWLEAIERHADLDREYAAVVRRAGG